MLIFEKTFSCSMFSQSVSLKMLHMGAFPKGMMVCVCVCVGGGGGAVCVCVCVKGGLQMYRGTSGLSFLCYLFKAATTQ